MISSTLIGWGLKLLALVAILSAAYAFGHSSGYTTGYASGWDAQQKTIDKMVSDANAQRTAQNNQITTLEQQAAKDASDLFAAKAAAVVAAQTIVTQYQTKYVEIANSCGWSAPTVDTINSLLNVEQVPTITGVAK